MVLLDSIQRDRAFSIATNLDSNLKDRCHQVWYLWGKSIVQKVWMLQLYTRTASSYICFELVKSHWEISSLKVLISRAEAAIFSCVLYCQLHIIFEFRLHAVLRRRGFQHISFWQNLQRVLEWLESEEYGASPEEVSHYKAQCHAIYPRAQAFKPPQIASTSVNDSTSNSTTITTPSTTTTANHNHVDFPSSWDWLLIPATKAVQGAEALKVT